MRETEYLWYDCVDGVVYRPSGSVLDVCPTLDAAAAEYPHHTFRLYNVSALVS